MKVLPPGYAAKIAAETNRLAICLRIERKDGFLVCLTSSDVPVVVSGDTYVPDPGLTTANFRATSGFNVGNTEVQFFKSDAYVNRNDVLLGRWAFAKYSLFRVDPLDPTAGVEVFSRGNLGDMNISVNGFTAELRDYRQLLQQQVGEVLTKTCVTQLFSPRCGVDRVAHTFTGTLTSVLSLNSFADSALARPNDWFTSGEFEMTSGAAQGARFKVRGYTSAGGVFVFTQPTFILPSVGDAYVAYTGCQKRWAEDCVAKFNNGRRFQGQPHIPGQDFLTSPGDVSNA